MKALPPLILLLTFTLGACAQNEPPKAPEKLKPRVEVETVSLADLTDSITLNAEVEPVRHTRISSGSGGKVDSVLVEEGDTVAKGKLLARIASGLAHAQLKQAEAALAAAKSTHARVQKLAAEKLASSATVEQADLGLAQAEAAVEMARVRYSDALVTAPHAGAIAKRFISTGEQAPPGAPVFDLVDISQVKIVGQLAERDAPFIDVGRDAQIIADAWPGETFIGKVSRVGVVAAKHSRTFDLEILVDNSAGRLRPGMLTRLNIARRVLKDIPTVRRDAVVEDLDGRALFVEKDGLVNRRHITIGPGDGERVAVTNGLGEGERVVVVGQRSLVNDQQVEVVVVHPAVAEESVSQTSTGSSKPKTAVP